MKAFIVQSIVGNPTLKVLPNQLSYSRFEEMPNGTYYEYINGHCEFICKPQELNKFITDYNFQIIEEPEERFLIEAGEATNSKGELVGSTIDYGTYYDQESVNKTIERIKAKNLNYTITTAKQQFGKSLAYK